MAWCTLANSLKIITSELFIQMWLDFGFIRTDQICGENQSQF